MKKLTAQQIKRWNAAKNTVQAIIDIAISEDASIRFDGMDILPSQIKITNSEISVIDGMCTYQLFVADPDYDAGLFDTILEFDKMLHRRFSLVKTIAW